MFTKTRNIDTAFKHIRAFSLVMMVACVCITAYALYISRQAILAAQQKIYILANGKVLEAFAAERKDNIGVEAKDHVSMFHHYFFTLDPDDKVIQSNTTKALYLADASAKNQYDNLQENGYYSNLIAGNISQQLSIDTVTIDIDQYPYYFKCKAAQKIIRATSIVTRSLLTEGFLRNVSRSDNNPHGFLIEKWRIIDNTDIKVENR